MKQGIAGSVVVSLVLCATSCFAQFSKAPALAARNAAKISKYTTSKVAQATARSRILPGMGVPAQILKGGQQVMLRTPAMPTVGNNVNASYLYQHQALSHMYKDALSQKSAQEIQEYMALRWTGSTYSPGIGKAFYEDQSALAKDLNTFYEGAGVAVTVPGGEMAKLYALPVDGILYKPEGYTEPVVLTAADDFVIYYPRTKTGQLVQNTPQMQQLFNRQANSGAFNEVITLGGKEFEIPQGEPDWDLLNRLEKVEAPAEPIIESDGVDFEEVK